LLTQKVTGQRVLISVAGVLRALVRHGGRAWVEVAAAEVAFRLPSRLRLQRRRARRLTIGASVVLVQPKKVAPQKSDVRHAQAAMTTGPTTKTNR